MNQLQQLQTLYLQFLANFPVNTRPVISMALALFLVYSILKVIRKDFIFIIALLILLPTSVPMLQNVWQGIVEFIKFLLNTK